MFSNLDISLVVIDLDNTLYEANNGVFARMDAQMNAYIRRELGLNHEQADKIRVKYWKQYGSTLKGLMQHHGHDAEPFLQEAHDINAHELLNAQPELHDVLQAMPERKVIHTNGTSEHAETILQALGIRQYFSKIYDIRFNQYTPKPCVDTLQQLFAEEGASAAQVLVIDDMENNLAVAKQAGTKTAWIHADANKQYHAWDIAAESFVDLLVK
jgi:putative hydrolase of the HAD superfamily